MSQARPLYRIAIAVATGTLTLLAVAGCQERARTVEPVPTTPTAPPSTPVPTTSSSDPVQVPGKGTDVTQQKGTETGMIGGASGTVASGGKPGSGTVSGAGTGPAKESGDRIENKK